MGKQFQDLVEIQLRSVPRLAQLRHQVFGRFPAGFVGEGCHGAMIVVFILLPVGEDDLWAELADEPHALLVSDHIVWHSLGGVTQEGTPVDAQDSCRCARLLRGVAAPPPCLSTPGGHNRYRHPRR